MNRSLSNLTRLDRSHARKAGEMLARAFEHNPLTTHIIPDDSKRKNTFRHLYEFVINYGILYGEVYATSPRIEGVAVWLHSERSKMTLWKMIRAGGLPLYVKTGKKFISQVLSVANRSASTRSAFAPSRHWYLFYLGVDPEFRGRGYATELLKPMLNRIDGEGLHGYLETYVEKNIDIYKRYGFKVVGWNPVPSAGINIWSMVRPGSGPEPLASLGSGASEQELIGVAREENINN